MWRRLISFSRLAHWQPVWHAVGSAAAGTTAPMSQHKTQRYQHKPRSASQSRPIAKSRQREPRLKPLSNVSAPSRARSRSLRNARLVAALCLPITLSSCALWRQIVPQNVTAVCAESVAKESCPAPVYVFADGEIAADVAAAVAIAESKARDACAEQLEELQGCVKRHNEGK